ncbi:MAG: hypothetical protein KIS92_15490 [Planctomycetota bacterium]|nr:hypothetical protein [Planctomycetota bacterium]
MALEPLDEDEYQELLREGRERNPGSVFRDPKELAQSVGAILLMVMLFMAICEHPFLPNIPKWQLSIMGIVSGLLIGVPHLISCKRFYLIHLIIVILLIAAVSSVPVLLS